MNLNFFTQSAIDVIKSIPKGKVMTYGQVARMAGNPRGARQVVRILHSMSRKYNLPWHRVINSKGEIGFQDDERYNEQKLLLQIEDIEISRSHRISLKQYQFHPSDSP